MGSAEAEKVEVNNSHDHQRILERLIPESGLLLPENPVLMRGTTGLKILIYDFGESNPTNIPEEIMQVYPELIGIPNMLVLKMRGDEENEHPYFANNGSWGNETVVRETEVDQRVLASGLIPSALGKGRIEERKDGSYLVSDGGGGDDERTVAMVMPYYDTEFCGAIGEMSEERRREVMEQSVELLFAFERDVPEDKRSEYEGLVGVATIVEETFERARDWYQQDSGEAESLRQEETDEKETADRAIMEFEGSFSSLISNREFREFIDSEVDKRCFVDTHGDLRPHDNANLITTQSENDVLVFRDPVRLFRKDIEDWTNFHLTHRAYQLGLLTGRLFTEGNVDMVGYGVEAYLSGLLEKGVVESENIEDLSKQETQMIGLSMCYGIFVEILVARGMIRIGEYEGPTISDYWKAVQFLTEDEFGGWTRQLQRS